jgi:pimeloyl-ACP methyl ester carboxylesterase
MHIDVNGTRLWFDVEGPSWVPDGEQMRERPAVVLLHGGPGSFDHSYFKPDFGRLAKAAQVVYLDLRDHGRSAWGNPGDWSYEICADDVRAFCDTLGLVRPIVHGHSMGGFIAMLYGARHPGHARALVLDSTAGRFDIPRMVEHFRQLAGDEVGRTIEREYGTGPVTAEEWAACWRLFGPGPVRSRAIVNAALNQRYLPLMGRFNALDQLVRIACPTLVCAGSLDPAITPAIARELAAALPPGLAHLEIVEGAGHFPWLGAPERYWPVLEQFVNRVAAA